MSAFSSEKSHACILKNPKFFHTSTVLRLKQAPFSVVRVVSTRPSKTFLVNDVLVESFTTRDISMSISADPDCLPRKLPEKKHIRKTRNKPNIRNVADIRKEQTTTKKVNFLTTEIFQN